MRLLRAAAAEQAQLDRHRARLLQAREELHAELERVERGLAEVDERHRLLDRLAPAPSPTAPTTASASGERGPTSAARSTVTVAGGGSGEELRGPAIRAEAVRLLLADPAAPEALHYRDWFQRLRDAGFTVAGKDPEAVFLTQLTRSPVLRKSTQAGVYELDRHAPARLRRELDDPAHRPEPADLPRRKGARRGTRSPRPRERRRSRAPRGRLTLPNARPSGSLAAAPSRERVDASGPHAPGEPLATRAVRAALDSACLRTVRAPRCLRAGGGAAAALAEVRAGYAGMHVYAP
jgi:hypothetical protein